jgi:hypothetical protein
MKTLSVVVFFILLSLLCGVGQALRMYQNESQLILISDQIVYGKIVDVKSAWNAQNTHIETTAQVLVNDTFKSGDNTTIGPGSTILVTVPGGTVGNKSEFVEDTPFLIKDAETVLFLKKTTNEKYSVISLYGVTGGKIGFPLNATSAEPANDVASFKQKITDTIQGKVSDLTRPGIVIPTTQKAPVLFAPVISLIAIMLISRKMLR